MKLQFKILLCLVLFAGCSRYEFTPGQILLPDYVHTDTLIVTKGFNIPDSVSSDGEISDFLKDKTIKK